MFQAFYLGDWTFKGDKYTTGVIGTTSNGIMYLSMPLLFGLFTRRWSHRRRTAALVGAALTGLSFLLSAFSTRVWQLIVTQGIISAFGCSLMYSPVTLSLGEWFDTDNRALVYGLVLSCKGLVGTACPFIFRAMINKQGYRLAMVAWTVIVSIISLLGVLFMPAHPSSLTRSRGRDRKIPWAFARHRSIYIYAAAVVVQGSGYGIPQTYLGSYAEEVAFLSVGSGTLLLALFNAASIFATVLFGWLGDLKGGRRSSDLIATLPLLSSAVATFLFWALDTQGSIWQLVIFALTFGFFAGGYSGTWGGMLKQMETECLDHREAFDPGVLYGLLNGMRGVGYTGGGLVGLRLLEAGRLQVSQRFALGSSYGPLILFTALSSCLGGFITLCRL